MLLVYGANGYTGALVARRAASRGLDTILAGRVGRTTRLSRPIGNLPSTRTRPGTRLYVQGICGTRGAKERAFMAL